MVPPSLHADVTAALGAWADADASRIDAVCDAQLQRPATAVRLNSLGNPISPENLPFIRQPVPWTKGQAFFVDTESRPGGHLLYGTGAYYIQDASSLLAVSLLDPQPGEVVCDLCAAPGGKATAIAESLGDSGFLLANEVIRTRLGALRLNLARHGAWRYAISSLDPEKLADRIGPAFDAILVDAPCSGQSMIVRGKQTAGALDAKSVKLNARRQARILRAAARLLRPGGRLVYATCTYSWVENEQHVASLIDAMPEGWHPDPAPHLDAFAAGPPAPPACYRLWPDRHNCAGAFAARLRYEASDTPGSRGGSRTRRKPRPSARPQDIPFDEWGRWRLKPSLLSTGHTCSWLPPDAPIWAPDIGFLSPAALRKGRSWFPAYALAMRRDTAFEPHSQEVLDEAQAAAYLGRHPATSQNSGWCVCSCHGLPLGWGKTSAGVLKNHLPAAAQLRIEPA